MKWIWRAVGCILLGIIALSAQPRLQAAPPALPAKFSRVVLGQGLNAPTAMAFAGNKIFVIEKGGAIRTLRGDGTLRKRPFHTLHVSTQQERGLLGIVADPEYSTNRAIYVYYTTSHDSKRFSGKPENRVSRIKRARSGAVKERIILDNIPSKTSHHNGGDIHFGFDGKLYVSVGDNDETPSDAQRLDTPLGKILRINKDGTIPPDNPFYNTPGAYQATYAYGFRNPWRFAPRAETQSYLVADVGLDSWEEISVLQAGANYGWPQFEGPCPAAQLICDHTTVNYGATRKPLHWYHHSIGSEVGSVIVGGVFAENSNYHPPYAGAYFYADSDSSWVHVLKLDANNNVANKLTFDSDVGYPVSFAKGPDGNVYLVDLYNGLIYKYVYTP